MLGKSYCSNAGCDAQYWATNFIMNERNTTFFFFFLLGVPDFNYFRILGV